MAGSKPNHSGGIAGLALILADHGEAVEYDLLALGLRLDDLGTERLSWRDLFVVIHRAGPTSALMREVQPELSAWASGFVLADLLAHAVDLLAGGNWQRAGKKTAPKPKPIPRPGKKVEAQKYGSKPIPVKDFDDWWNGAS
jgi:hypothetical protein